MNSAPFSYAITGFVDDDLGNGPASPG